MELNVLKSPLRRHNLSNSSCENMDGDVAAFMNNTDITIDLHSTMSPLPASQEDKVKMLLSHQNEEKLIIVATEARCFRRLARFLFSRISVCRITLWAYERMKKITVNSDSPKPVIP